MKFSHKIFALIFLVISVLPLIIFGFNEARSDNNIPLKNTSKICDNLDTIFTPYYNEELLVNLKDSVTKEKKLDINTLETLLGESSLLQRHPFDVYSYYSDRLLKIDSICMLTIFVEGGAGGFEGYYYLITYTDNKVKDYLQLSKYIADCSFEIVQKGHLIRSAKRLIISSFKNEIDCEKGQVLNKKEADAKSYSVSDEGKFVEL
jgi:hypothetical protein